MARSTPSAFRSPASPPPATAPPVPCPFPQPLRPPCPRPLPTPGHRSPTRGPRSGGPHRSCPSRQPGALTRRRDLPGRSAPSARPRSRPGRRLGALLRAGRRGGACPGACPGACSGPGRGSSAGFTVVEALVVAAVLGILVALSWPPLAQASAKLRVRQAAGEVAGILQKARLDAVRYSASVAVRFERRSDGIYTWAVYRDGDGDGVRSRDIERGVDTLLAPARRLRRFGASVRPGFPTGRLPRDPGDPSRRLRRPEDPLRFNRSDMASFSPLGTSTPGSLYVTDGGRWVAAVRVYGRTGKVRVLVYDRETERWQ